MSDLQESINSLAERFGLAVTQLDPVIRERENADFELEGEGKISFSFKRNGTFMILGELDGGPIKESYIFDDDDFISLDALTRRF